MRRNHLLATILLLILNLLFPTPSPAYEVTPYSGHKFIWVKNNRAGFTEAEMQILARDYDLIVIGNQHAGGNKTIEYQDVKRLKEINPNVPIFLYFPTKKRATSSDWGHETFKDETTSDGLCLQTWICGTVG